MPAVHYSCKSCGYEFDTTVRTQPGPSVLYCPNCNHLTAVREPVEIAALRGAKTASLSGCCGVAGSAGAGLANGAKQLVSKNVHVRAGSRVQE